MVGADDIRERYPAFEEFPDSVILAFIAKVSAIDCPEAVWSELGDIFRDEGVKLCTAHYLTLELMQQAAISSLTTGVSKGNAPNLSQFSGTKHWDLTIYGLQFQDLQSNLAVTGFTF